MYSQVSSVSSTWVSASMTGMLGPLLFPLARDENLRRGARSARLAPAAAPGPRQCMLPSRCSIRPGAWGRGAAYYKRSAPNLPFLLLSRRRCAVPTAHLPTGIDLYYESHGAGEPLVLLPSTA